ncbi:MAG: hypothetical protein IJN16_02915 [Lachnospiraceae bacterium]|nr:hypothetical protein [Lachnospiraceae bacterium]
MRLSYPEAEVTISLSSNVYKSNYFYGAELPSDKKVIDTNELIASRLETLAEIMKQKELTVTQTTGTGFVQGLQAEDVSALLSDEEDGTAVIKAEAPNTEAILQQAREEAERLVANAKAQADTIVAEGMEQAALSKKNVLEEARMNGYREGINRANKEVEEMKAQLAARQKALESEYEAQFQSMEMDLVETITNIYEHIFNVDLRSNREILLHLITTTMRKVEGGRSFIIHVSKEDYPMVSMQKKQILSGLVTSSTSVDVIEDLTLAKGECFIEAEGGIFECGIGTQLKELNKKLRILSYES